MYARTIYLIYLCLESRTHGLYSSTYQSSALPTGLAHFFISFLMNQQFLRFKYLTFELMKLGVKYYHPNLNLISKFDKILKNYASKIKNFVVYKKLRFTLT